MSQLNAGIGSIATLAANGQPIMPQVREARNITSALASNPALAEMFLQVGAAINGQAPMPIGQEAFTVRKHTYYHKQDITASTTGTVRFFNGQPTQYVTNWPGGGSGLPNDLAFWVEKFYIDIELNTAAPTAAQLTALQALLNSGEINFQVGDRRLIENLRGIKRVPGGYGSVIDVSQTLSTAIAGAINNGQSHASNQYPFIPFPILPGKNVGATVQLAAAPADIPNISLVACMEGTLVSPANS